VVADAARMGESGNGEPDSKRSLWRAVWRLFDSSEGDQSLRAQIEGVINEHEGESQATSANGDLLPIERQMLRNLLHFSEHTADDVAIPRGAIMALPLAASWAEVVAAFAEHGHSRLPVHGETLDEVVGMMLMKDVFARLATGDGPPADWHALMRQPLFVPTARGALDVLADMRQSRVHLAVVLNEYSGTEGIITLEDLVEEIVGEVEDEHDDAPTELLHALPDGLWEADARAELDDVAERVDARLADVEEAVDTLGGLAFLLAGHVPQVGETLAHDSGWILEITDGDERHVKRLRLHPPLSATQGEG